ncbi:uncharacterized protein LOC110633572 isoform X2 [Hevea brasiliensis]|uniref:uncharacterized protein LOC110633572 isoform X2 n=1 Tax=Hevea brasiliensis TaxID=3981 RepID=UPI0025D2D795|nr:uncharacterized protein LOC110633572 isoform X2 [Hevea brasiliensis]
MSYSCVITLPSSLNASISAAHRPWHSGKNKTRPQAKRNEQLWRCVEGCGACCKLAKGPSFATPEEIFTDPSDIELYRSLMGPDGWCIHYDKSTRKCSIYPGLHSSIPPYVFLSLYGIGKKKFNKEACRSTHTHHLNSLPFRQLTPSFLADPVETQLRQSMVPSPRSWVISIAP